MLLSSKVSNVLLTFSGQFPYLTARRLHPGVVADTEAAAAEKYTSLVREDPKMKEMANSRIFVVNLCSQSIFGELCVHVSVGFVSTRNVQTRKHC